MTKEQLWGISKSLLITVAIAYICGLAAAGVSGKFDILPWSWFVLFFVLQIVGYPLYDMATERLTIARAITAATKEQTDVLEEAVSKQSLTLNCAYCSQPNNNVPIILTQENSFKCVHCGQDNAIYMQFYAARKTSPVIRKVEAEKLEKGTPEATPI